MCHFCLAVNDQRRWGSLASPGWGHGRQAMLFPPHPTWWLDHVRLPPMVFMSFPHALANTSVLELMNR